MRHLLSFACLPLLLAACSSSATSDGGQELAAAGTCIPASTPTADLDACKFAAGAKAEDTLGSCSPGRSLSLPVEHVVLLMQENRSFDHYFGKLKGNGQDDVEVAPDTATNPAPGGASTVPWHHEGEFCFADTNHEWDGSHTEWNGGQMDGFPAANVDATDPTGSRSMGYYTKDDLPFHYALASTYAISDRYFCSVIGPTWPNRMYFYAASSFGRVENVPAPDTAKTIFEVLDDAGITWKVYKANTPGAGMFLGYVTSHLTTGNFVPLSQFAADAAAGTLPQVAWIDPELGTNKMSETSEHPPADPQYGAKFLYDQVTALQASPLWPTSAMFITYDEHGGLYDHVAPPAACAPDGTAPAKQPELGGFDHLGFRVPVFVVSPFAKKHFVSHETHSHTSILRFVELKFGLPALSARDANSDAMLDMFDFENPPFATPPSFTAPAIDPTKADACAAKYPK